MTIQILKWILNIHIHKKGFQPMKNPITGTYKIEKTEFNNTTRLYNNKLNKGGK